MCCIFVLYNNWIHLICMWVIYFHRKCEKVRTNRLWTSFLSFSFKSFFVYKLQLNMHCRNDYGIWNKLELKKRHKNLHKTNILSWFEFKISSKTLPLMLLIFLFLNIRLQEEKITCVFCFIAILRCCILNFR